MALGALGLIQLRVASSVTHGGQLISRFQIYDTCVPFPPEHRDPGHLVDLPTATILDWPLACAVLDGSQAPLHFLGPSNDQAQGQISLSSSVDISLRPYVGYNEPGIHRCKGRTRCCCYRAGNPNNSNPYDFIHFHCLDIESFVPPPLQGHLESHGPISSEIPIDPVLQQQSAHAT